MRRGLGRAVGAVVVGALSVHALLVAPAGQRAAAAPPLKWGAFPVPRAGETPMTALQRIEAEAGRKLDTVRVFYKWDDPFPTSYENTLKATGHTLIISVKPRRRNGTSIPWATVASAQPGSAVYNDIVRWADAVRDFGAPIYVTFLHEPEAASNLDLGINTDYIAAWRHWVDIFRAEGATNAKFMWIMTSWAFTVGSSDRRQAIKWYPGDAYVDGIAGDAYNWYTCRTDAPAVKWESLQQIIAGQRTFWLSHQSKEDWITEYGTAEDPNQPGRKAQWYSDAQALFKTADYAQFTGVELFEHDNFKPTCAWDEDTSASAQAAWVAWGQDPYYGGPGGTGTQSVLTERFDNGLGDWTGSGLVLDSTTGGASAPSVVANAAGAKAFLQRTLPSTYASLCLSAAVSLASHTGSISLLKLRTAGGGPVTRLFVDPTGVLYARDDFAAASFRTTGTLGSGWHTVTLCTTVGSSGQISVRLDGAAVGSWTANTGTANIGQVRIGDESAVTYHGWFDDIVAQ